MYFCSGREPGETRMPWSLTRPKRKDWSEFSTFRKKKNLTSLLHEVSLKDVTPPLDETPPSDRSYGEGERNFGDKSLAFSAAGSVFGGAGDVSRHETDFVEEDNLQEDGNILNSILSHSKQFLVLNCFSFFSSIYNSKLSRLWFFYSKKQVHIGIYFLR